MNIFNFFMMSALTSSIYGSEDADKWADYKHKFGKGHGLEEDNFRKEIFTRREFEIEEHNRRFAAGLENYSSGHNQYSDLTPDESSRYAFGFIPVMNPSDIPFIDVLPRASLPEKFDWREHGIVTQAKNQKYCGSCYAFAAASVVESQLLKKLNETFDISEQDVVDCSYRRYMFFMQNRGCNGGWPSAAFQYFQDKGFTTEKNYAYTSGDTRTQGFCKSLFFRSDRVVTNLTYRHVKTRNEREIAQLLLDKGPLVFALAADGKYKQRFINLKEGIFDDITTVNLDPNHAAVIVGFGTEGGKDYWLIKNSWGKSWGMNGFGKIRRGKNMCNMTKFGVWYVEL